MARRVDDEGRTQRVRNLEELGFDEIPPAQAESQIDPTIVARDADLGRIRVDETVILEGPPPALAWLVVVSGPRTGLLCRLRKGDTTVGRDPNNDLVLDDGAVSAQHVKVRVEKGESGEEGFFLYDLASQNGTFVRGEKILRHGLKDGDRIVIGQTNLVFKEV